MNMSTCSKKSLIVFMLQIRQAMIRNYFVWLYNCFVFLHCNYNGAKGVLVWICGRQWKVCKKTLWWKSSFTIKLKYVQYKCYLPASGRHGDFPISGTIGWVAPWWSWGSAGHRVTSVVWRGELLWRKRERQWINSASAWTMMQCVCKRVTQKTKVYRGRNSPPVF